ncbi:LOW QUALITY PROTEIN: transcriptional protein SWT1 [Osmerus mordax]|uniref:LOW QUALITY PROTEIN: transcriptional protein SWT1 n=1 Tax=Osmerus mordax TaxID=8014 RepID=UPI00350FAB6E
MHKKKSKKKSKKNKKESKRLSSTSSENDEKTLRREDSQRKRKSSEKIHLGHDHDSPTENTRRGSSTSGKLVSETSPKPDRPFKTAVYRLGKTESQREEKDPEKTHACRPASLSKDGRATAAVLHEGANVSASKPLGAHSADTASRREQRSSSSKSSSGKSSHKTFSAASSPRHGPSSRASSGQAPSSPPLSADLEEQRRMLVRQRPRPEEKPSPADGKPAKARVSPGRGAEEPGEKRRRLGRRASPEDAEEARRTAKDQEGRQKAVSPLETTQGSSSTTRDESSGTSTQASKPAVSKHVAELSETAKPAVSHFNTPNTKPKLPLTFTIPKKTKPITARSGIWDEDDKAASERKQKTTDAVRKPTQSKAEFGSKLMVPRKIRIGPMDRSSSVTKTKQIRGTAPEASVSTSVTPASPPLQKHEEKPSVVTSSVPTDASSSEPAETYDTDQEMQLVEELHLARSERRLEVNVEEIYGELTCMDIDPPEEGATHTQNKELIQQELIVVLDTNILLSHLGLVKKMISHGLGGLGFPTVLIPWVVLQELDSLKNGKRLSSSVAHLATPAVHYIYTSLKSQEPRLWGQSMQQASQSSLNLNAENNDDRVLQCCLQYQSLYPEGALVLCTNDKNLCSKSLLSGVRALSKVDLVEEMEKATPVLLSPLHPQTPAPAPTLTQARTPSLNQASLTPTPQSSFQRTSPSPRPAGKDEGRISDGHQRARNEEKEKRKEVEEEEGRRRRCAAKEARELSVCVSALEDCLKGALSQILEVEMKAVFEDLWTEIVYIKPPWTLADLLQCFRKHWIAVFGNIVPRSLLQSVENLCDFLRSGKTVKLRSATVAVCEARELLQSFSCRPVYSGSVSPALSSLDLLQQRLHALPEKAPEERLACDGDALMAEEEQGEKQGLSPHAAHQEVWALFELIWTNVCQISSVVFTALRFDPAATAASQLWGGGPPPPPDALSCLQRLLSTVTQLLQGFSRVLSPDVNLEDSQALLSFIVSSQIAAVEPRCTAKHLQDCLSQQEYREKLFMGGSQMAELRGSLERCVEAMAHRTIITPWL